MVFPAVWRGFLSLHPTADLRHSAVAAGGLIALLQLLLHRGSSVLLAGAGEQHGCQTEWEQFSPPCIYTLGSSFVWEIWEKNLLDLQGVEYTEPFPVIMTKEEDPFSFWLACSWEDLHVKCVSEYFVICVSLSKQGLDDPHTPAKCKDFQLLSSLSAMFGWWPCWFPELFSPLAEMVLAAKHPHILSFARHSSWILLFTKSNVKSFEKWRHPFKSTVGHVKSHCPTRTCPRYLSCLPYPGHSDTWPCESCLCLGNLLEMCGAGVHSIFCQQLTCKELPCGTGGNERSQLEERPKELKGKLKGHVLDQRNKVLMNMICVHLYVNEAHSVWLPRVLLGRIFRRTEACSLISSCCCGACSWDIHRLLQPGHGLSAHMSWRSAVLTQSVAENEGNATFPPCANGARETEQWMVFWDREGRSFWSQLFEATVAWHVATLCISPSRACLKKRKRDGKWVLWPMGGLQGLPRWNASLLTLQILSSGLVKLPSYGRDFSRDEVAASYFILS